METKTKITEKSKISVYIKEKLSTVISLVCEVKNKIFISIENKE